MVKKKTLIIMLLLVVNLFAIGQNHKVPPMKGNMPNFVSSGWSIIRLGVTGKPLTPSGDVIVFCSGSHFSYVPASGIGPEGNFKVQGNTLTLISSSADRTKSVYKMTWNGRTNLLKLEGSGVVMELVYNGASTCKG